MSAEDALYPLLSAYERLPQGLKAGVGWAWRHLPQQVRLGSSYGEFRNLADRAEAWSATEIAEYQLEQLRVVLLHASEHSPFYARRFAEAGFDPRGVEEPRRRGRVPVHHEERSRRSSRRDGNDCAPSLGPPLHDDRRLDGRAGRLLSAQGCEPAKGAGIPRGAVAAGGYFDGARLAVIRGHVTTDRSEGRIASYDATRNWLMLSSYHLTAARLPEYLDKITRFRPDILHAYPSAALQLAEFMNRSGEKWPVPLRCVLAGSERLTGPQKQLLERTFGCRVYHWYGHAERVVLAGAGRSSDLLYFWPAYGYVEFGPPDDEGLQEVIGTSFHNLVMPLIRYQTGDYVRVHDPERDGPKEFRLAGGAGSRRSCAGIPCLEDRSQDLAHSLQHARRQF